MTDFAVYLKEARLAAGLNQLELAEKAGLTGSYISVLESRRKPPPSDGVLKRLARALGAAESELLEVAHLDRTPVDIRKKIRAMDRRLNLERRLTHRLLSDHLPSSLWHFWRVRGFHEYGLEKLRLNSRERKVLRKVLRRIGHLTERDDFEEESRRILADLPPGERAVLADVLPELLPMKEVDRGPGEPPEFRRVPLLLRPPSKRTPEPEEFLPVAAGAYRPGLFALRASDEDMLPRIEEGDVLLVDPDATPNPGDLALVRLGKQWTVRQISGTERLLVLVAANPKVPPIEAKADRVTGVVVEVRRRLR